MQLFKFVLFLLPAGGPEVDITQANIYSFRQRCRLWNTVISRTSHDPCLARTCFLVGRMGNRVMGAGIEARRGWRPGLLEGGFGEKIWRP